MYSNAIYRKETTRMNWWRSVESSTTWQQSRRHHRHALRYLRCRCARRGTLGSSCCVCPRASWSVWTDGRSAWTVYRTRGTQNASLRCASAGGAVVHRSAWTTCRRRATGNWTAVRRRATSGAPLGATFCRTPYRSRQRGKRAAFSCGPVCVLYLNPDLQIQKKWVRTWDLVSAVLDSIVSFTNTSSLSSNFFSDWNLDEIVVINRINQLIIWINRKVIELSSLKLNKWSSDAD